MKTVIASALLLSGAALAQNPAPIGWVAPPGVHLVRDGAWLRMDNVAVGDLTEDGLPDVVYLNRTNGEVRLLGNSLRGHKWPQTGALLQNGSPDGFVEVGDFDGNGHLDYVTTVRQEGGGLWLEYGTRQDDGSFAGAINQFVGARQVTLDEMNGLSVADVTGDGIDDVALNDPDHWVSTYTLDNFGFWIFGKISLAQFPALAGRLQFGDFEGDGDIDAFGSLDNTPLMLRNDGALPWNGTGPARAALGAGRFAFADVLPGNGVEVIGSTADNLYIMRKRAPNDWGAWEQTPHLGMYQPVAVDFDGDDDLDLVGTALLASENLVFLENLGAGEFRQQRVGTGASPNNNRGRVWPADVNGDGSLDFVVSYDSVEMHVYAAGQGVLGATFERNVPEVVQGRARLYVGVVTVEPLVALPEPVAITEVTALLGGAPADQVLEAVEVVHNVAGRPVVGRIEGDALRGAAGGMLRVPLDGEGILVDNEGSVGFTIYFTTRADAHQAAPELHVSWDSVSATFTDGEPAPVVSQIVMARTWTLPNAAPVAQADAFAVAEGGTALLGVLANDSDGNGDPLTIEIVEGPTSGALVLEDGQVRYTHDGREAPREDRFTYRALDPRADASEVVAVTLTITPVNDVPVGAPDAYVTREDVPLVMEADLGLLANDTDGDDDLLSVVLDAPPAVGELQLEPDGRFIYLPAPDMHGEVTFTYRPVDAEAEGEPVVVTITVLPQEDPPRPAAGPFATDRDTPVALNLGGADPEGRAIVLLIEGLPDRGHFIRLRPNEASVTYVPPAGFTGEVRFAYRLSDRVAVSEVFEAVIRVGL